MAAMATAMMVFSAYAFAGRFALLKQTGIDSLPGPSLGGIPGVTPLQEGNNPLPLRQILKMRHFSMLFLSILVFGMSCNNETNKTAGQEEAAKDQAPPVSRLSDEGTGKLVALLSQYYIVKDALVKTDGTEASVAAEKLAMTTTEFQMFLVKDSVNQQMAKLRLDTIRTASMEMGKTHPAEVETMRASFEKVSDNMYALMSSFELKNAGIYRQYCPMAFNDKGAYWLSNEEDIKNPYFGKKMLSCGEVTDSLK
ncbi:MAG: DUF3347 domain-containing protein [Sphingobacteriales bacterium]|nr:MAG: DUF3347 domain-containing protein [Sphingobacteriales bacterium]